MGKELKIREISSRRDFVKQSVLTFAGITIVPRYVLGRGYTAPSDKIQLGFIGLGKQSRGLSSNFIKEEQCNLIAGCDVWTTKNEWFVKHVSQNYQEVNGLEIPKGFKTYTNYKELLDRDDIDGVIVATPDHWHALQSIDAMKSGKDVYCEKPLTHTIEEGINMVKAARETGAVVQTGSMQRSWADFRRACELVRSGRLGQIKQVLVNVGDPAIPYNLPAEDLPAQLNWNAWCGPAPLLPYNHQLAPSNNDVNFWPHWRTYEETGGGILADWGAHMFDIVQWALAMDDSGPVRYIPPKDLNATRGLIMYYRNGIEMRHEDFGRGWGVRFIGTEGSLDVSRNYLETTPASLMDLEYSDSTIKDYNSNENHYNNWLNAMRNRTRPICDVETGHRSASICNIANIAYNLGRELEWDPQKERFEGDHEANRLKSNKPRKYNLD